RDPPFRFRGGRLVLALRRRRVAVPLLLHLCLGQGTDRLLKMTASAEPSTLAAIVLARCPRCGRAPLFSGYLTVAPRCASCGLDFAVFDVGDGATVFVILIAGFL